MVPNQILPARSNLRSGLFGPDCPVGCKKKDSPLSRKTPLTQSAVATTLCSQSESARSPGFTSAPRALFGKDVRGFSGRSIEIEQSYTFEE
jgi:hypothetical protein